MRRFTVLFLVLVLAGILIFSGIVSAKEELKIGLVYIGPVGDAGWTYAHDLGRQYIEEKFPEVETTYIESVPEGSESISVIKSLARKKYDIVFTTSFGYMNPTIQVAAEYPDTVFEHCSGYKTAENVGTYFGRMYQARYLTGIVAGSMTESNTIGYVAAHPIPEVIRGINAFTLGVKYANPEAKVNVVWTNTWYDPGIEKEAAISLLDIGADVIAQHQDTPAPQQAAEERGVYSIGYNVDMAKFAPEAHLTAPVWDWGIIYEDIVEKVMDGSWKTHETWWGLKENAVDIAPFGPMVTDDVKAKVAGAREAIISGDLEVFGGAIKDQDGNIVVPAGENMTDLEMLQMNFFVEGVIGHLPEN